MPTVAEITPEELQTDTTEALSAALALRVRGFFCPERAARAAEAVSARRAAWVSDFGGLQFCLGRAWYTHLETGRTGEYFAGAPASDALVEETVPGLQEEMRRAVHLATGAPVIVRRGWCSAGVHVFPARGACAEVGGDLHFDDEGLSRAQLRARSPALSLVLMLQPPETGGALRLWDARYEGHPRPTKAQLSAPSIDVRSEAGDLVVFDSYRLHQIQPFEGDKDRISATLHAARLGNSWESWF